VAPRWSQSQDRNITQQQSIRALPLKYRNGRQ